MSLFHIAIALFILAVVALFIGFTAKALLVVAGILLVLALVTGGVDFRRRR